MFDSLERIIPPENFSFKYLLRGKNCGVMWIDPAPTDSTKLFQWKVKDARVMSWIFGYVDPLIVLNLRPYKTTKIMWKYLKKVYYQDNNARRFQLENDISNYSQCNLSIQDYYSGF